MRTSIVPSQLPPEDNPSFGMEIPVETSLPSANDSGTNGVARPVFPRPPDPSVGGIPGRTVGLGYGSGLLPDRTFHQHLTGTVLQVGQPVPPVVGPVGYRDFSSNLAQAVNAQQTDPTPSESAVAQMFVGRTFSNPLGV